MTRYSKIHIQEQEKNVKRQGFLSFGKKQLLDKELDSLKTASKKSP